MDTFFFVLKLDQAAAFVGVLGLLAGLALLAAPAACRAYVPGIGRHQPTAWVLTALDLLWVAWIVNNASLGRFDALKPGLYLLTPAAFFLIIFYMDDLLAVRVLGGLLLLMANPVLNAARWVDTEWRFVMTVLAYGWAVAGIALVLSPYLWRRWTTPLLATDARCRASGLAKLAAGAALLYLAWRIY
jgi:uncharacterized protein YjeT (DUF2065 family)